jgi:hypothetical protein
MTYNSKRWSLGFTRNLVLSLLFILTVLVMSLFLVSAGLRCVDMDGCLREHCVAHFDRFQDQYKDLVRQSMKGNAKCRIQI